MDRIKIGWAKREISTEEPVSIPGQGHLRISEGILDPLYVTALCLDGGEGEDVVVFLSCDVISLRGGVIDLVEKAVRERIPYFPEHAIVMNATHTHTGATLSNTPETAPDGAPIYPGEKFREEFVKKCADAVAQSYRFRAPGGIAFGYGYAVVAHSRRVVYFEDMSEKRPNAMAPNGHAVMYGNTRDPLFSHYEAGADHFLNALFTFNAKDEVTGVVVNVPCPSQFSELYTKLSADYWNEVREGVKQEFGENVFVLPQCAAAGDLSPRILHYKEAQQRRMRLKYGIDYDLKNLKNNMSDWLAKSLAERRDAAERILDGLRDIYSWSKKDILRKVPIRRRFETISLKMRKITDEEAAWMRKNIEDMKDAIPSTENATPEELRYAKSRYNSVLNRNTRTLKRYEEQGEDPRIPMRMHVVEVGDVAFATNRFELYMDFMHRIQARSPFLQTFIVQIAGEENSTYLPTKRGEEGKGYSASVFCNVVGSEGGQQIVEETLRILNELKEESKGQA